MMIDMKSFEGPALGAGTEAVKKAITPYGIFAAAVKGEKAAEAGDEMMKEFRQNPEVTENALLDSLDNMRENYHNLSVTVFALNGEAIGVAHQGTGRLYHVSREGITLCTPEEATRIWVAENNLTGEEGYLLCTEGFLKQLRETEILIDFTKSNSSEQWLSYLITRIGQRLEEQTDNFAAVAIMAKEES